MRRFNEGVRSGDFGSMIGAFTEDAELAFEGVRVGPFVGRDAIAEAYRTQPPDDEIGILHAEEGDDRVVRARYVWLRGPATAAGEMRLTRDGERISRLVVTFD